MVRFIEDIPCNTPYGKPRSTTSRRCFGRPKHSKAVSALGLKKNHDNDRRYAFDLVLSEQQLKGI
jgi:hypothetical protein